MEKGLDEKTLKEFSELVSCRFIPDLLKIADNNNIDRNSILKLAADMLLTMSEACTFDNFEIEEGD